MNRILKILRYLIKGEEWVIIGDQENTDWMDEVQSCMPPWTSFAVLKDGLAVHWKDKEWLVIQGPKIEPFILKGNWHCRMNKPNCALLTTTGKSCYQIMKESYERRCEVSHV